MMKRPMDTMRSPRCRAVLAVLLAVAALAVCLAAGCQQEPKYPSDFQKATVDYVVDGDTIDVALDGRIERIRLAGIDAPESASHDEALNTEEGALATEYLRSLLPKNTVVYLQKDASETDKYGRLVRYVWLEAPDDPGDAAEVSAKMVDALMVEAGYAQAMRYWPDVAYADVLAEMQQQAVSAGRGVSHLWANE